MRKVIAVASGKGGVGKTVASLNIAMALHEMGEDVVIVDADLNNPAIGLHLDLFHVPTTINDVLERDIHILEALHIHPSGLRVIPSSVSIDRLHPNTYKFGEIFQDLDNYIIVDCAPGFGKEVLSVLEMCDEVLVVTNPNFPAVVGSMRLLEVAKNMDKKITGIILNRIGMSDVKDHEIEGICQEGIIIEVPYDRNVDRSIANKMPVVKYRPLSPASIQFQRAAGKITGKEYVAPRFLRIRRLAQRMR
ncbi:MAG: P-loop NTPase [Candidatus Aenigmarchaeota archaeon]|nr:P-loop NTPase [Candidatus Aenigmarchaeota archaeon]